MQATNSPTSPITPTTPGGGGDPHRMRKAASFAAIATMFAIGLLTTCLAPLLVGNVIYVLARIVVPTVTLPHTLGRYVHIAAITFLSFGIVFNFIMACAVHPGPIPQSYLDAARQYLTAKPNASLRHCQTCHVPKAPRSHHCAMCGECILKMDHHCPWINGCVGYNNYRYFFGFLLWLLVGTVYTATSCAHLLWFHDATWRHPYEKVAADTHQVFFVFVLTVAIAITMCLYVGFNLYEIYTNQSAVEVTIAKEITAEGSMFRNPYDLGWLGNAVENLGPETIPSVFMRFKWLRMLHLVMPNIQLMPHEGVWFPTNQHHAAASRGGSADV